MNMDKKIDESWKDNVEKEKQGSGQDPQASPGIEAGFPVFISSLGMQTLIALGELENPITKKKEPDLNQARYLIDIIQMLQEKTAANVTNEEKQMLENLLYQLRMLYVERAKTQG